MIRQCSIVMASLILAVCVAGGVWAGMPADQVRLQIERIVKVLADPGLSRPGIPGMSGRLARTISSQAATTSFRRR